MKLIDEIIEMTADGKKPLTDALRKCLILAFELKNEKLKEWVEKELNGFDKDNEVPKYRAANLHSKGNFFGIGGSRLTNRPLPLTILDSKHWHMLTDRLVQPIGAYESLLAAGPKGSVSIPWPPDLVLLYQESFIQGLALSSAWQEVPMSLIIGLCEEVRNRLLRFALEVRQELGQVGDKPLAVPVAKVEAAVVNHIYGGTNVIAGAATNFSQVGKMVVGPGDFEGLAKILAGLNVSGPQIGELKDAIDADHSRFGTRTKEWMKKVVKGGLKTGVAVGQEALKEALLRYFNLK